MAPRSSLPSKKRKLAHDAQHDTPDHIAQIKSLEDQLIAAVTSKSSLNPLSDLLDIARNASVAHVLSKAMYALYRVFVVIISNGLLLASTGNDETKAVRAWIQEKIDAFVELLIGLLQDEESILKVRIAAYNMCIHLCSNPKLLVPDVLPQDSLLSSKTSFNSYQ